jgi:hypothetical protein
MIARTSAPEQWHHDLFGQRAFQEWFGANTGDPNT